MWCIITRYCLQHGSRKFAIKIVLWAHKRHPITSEVSVVLVKMGSAIAQPHYDIETIGCQFYPVVKHFILLTPLNWIYNIYQVSCSRFARCSVLLWLDIGRFCPYHDDVIKWKHFPRYWPFVRGINRSLVNSPHKGQWHGALMFSFICAWINDWVNNREGW